ncbi:MAG: DUF4280 domain-containing protein [Candidatus Paracaedibacteraceae bacterium]|nr:DUF4280 domain-containing protein [Candidatus Paracaedibacteraceae bacterium]
MAQLLVNNAIMMCSFGSAPCNLVVLDPTVQCSSNAMANIMDYVFPTNISGFKMCTSPGNPSVAAKFGAPSPCSPNISAPWTPGLPDVLVRNMPAVDNTCMLNCGFGGVINVTFAGQINDIAT